MNKVLLLGANQSYDRDVQTVNVKQIVQMEGNGYGRYVVHDIRRDRWGVHYDLINLRTQEFDTANLIRPLSQKFGIGFYYDEQNPQFMDDSELLILRSQAEEKKAEQEVQAEKDKQESERLKAIGAERLRKLIPADAKAAIIASLRVDESDSQRDYFGYSTQRSVILGFSTHTKNNFDEMRRFARNFEGTAHLAQKNPDYEHRENYSGGCGYYLGTSSYSGWTIEKDTFSDPETFAKRHALTAGDEGNICISVSGRTATANPEPVTGDFTIVRYSEKSVAVFGDTKAIKDRLFRLGGRFNKYLTLNGEKQAGWVFALAKEEALRELIGTKQVDENE